MALGGIMLLLFSFQIGTASNKALADWLAFHRFEENEFKAYDAGTALAFDWTTWSLSPERRGLFAPFLVWSPDSAYFIDLDSYSLVLERENGKLVSSGGEIDTKVQLVDRRTDKSTTILFCGADCIPEAVTWTSARTLLIMGFTRNDGDRYHPCFWRIDVDGKWKSEFRSERSFSAVPDNFTEKVWLKGVEFKH